MTSARADRPWPWILLGLVGLTLLYAGPLRTPLLNDDYLFLEQARTRPLLASLTDLGPLGNYYRPLSRQIYFELLGPIANGQPLLFHLANYGLFLASLALLADLLLALMPAPGALAGTLTFALLPFQRVCLTWVSCSQDLMALTGVLAALALYRRGRTAAALLPFAAALASKESAVPAPAALFAWDWILAGRPPGTAARRALPFALLSLLWAFVDLAMRTPHAAAPLVFRAGHFAAAYAHLAQSLVGMEHPPGFLRELGRNAPALLPAIALAPLALVFGRRRPGDASAPADASAPGAGARGTPPPPADSRPGSGIARFAVVWLAAFGAVIGPVVYAWSAYYYTLAAVGGALAIGALFRRARWHALLGLTVALLWVHAGGSESRAFAVVDAPWVWTSHLTSFYFERVAGLTTSMSRQLARLEPSPPDDARFFFADLPPFAGFQMGNGALVRSLYRKSGIETYFFSQYSESTAAAHPCRFFYWDGERFEPLYRGADPLFQVGSDLLLLGRTEGALYAFRRGLAAGESRLDHLYWIGWGELWRGRREAAEEAWTRLGFRDDSLRWIAHLRAAHNALVDGDSVESRRHLIKAIEYGVGRPEAHAVLGELMRGRNLKWGLLELKVATWLEPRDWAARRLLVRGLVEVRLDAAARRELEALERVDRVWRSDAALAKAERELAARAPAPSSVVEF